MWCNIWTWSAMNGGNTPESAYASPRDEDMNDNVAPERVLKRIRPLSENYVPKVSDIDWCVELWEGA